MSLLERQMIIAGPCALESEEDMQTTIEQAKKLGVSWVRANLWKPRTRPGFSGVGQVGLPWVRQALDAGLGVAMEVMLPDHAEVAMSLLTQSTKPQLILWLGSRNQNHELQRQIARVVAEHGGVRLMIKNQPWRDLRHWLGIREHVISAGLSDDRIIMCHRGFAPWNASEVEGRNVADLEMAKQVAETTGVPMILDPSHIAGKVSLVEKMLVTFANLPWVSGQLVEVHPDSSRAKTDASQQLSWDQLGKLLNDPSAGHSPR